MRTRQCDKKVGDFAEKSSNGAKILSRCNALKAYFDARAAVWAKRTTPP
jgi:hypothetical protein